MDVSITEEPLTAIADYARVPIAFTVDSVVDVTVRADCPGQFVLDERRVDIPYVKDYDAIDGQGPLEWARRFDISRWVLFAAHIAHRRVGGAAVAFNTPGLTRLKDGRDLAVLWDLRVAPDARGRGIGSLLFEKAEAWARSHGCHALEVETQNTNVRACRFYSRRGCELREINHSAYPNLPDEVQLLWYKDLLTSQVRETPFTARAAG
jgi:GNAT superfamily N-acetyltransferase